MLWHLFQHRATKLVVVTSYAWKAAQLVGSSFNPGYSTCTTFGINPFNPLQSANTEASKALLNRDVRMIICDEIGFTSPEHLAVRIGENLLQ